MGYIVATLITIFLGYLKVEEVIHWSWVWVASPLWGMAVIQLIVFVVMLVFMGWLAGKPNARVNIKKRR